ncbi:lysosome-associated membrane glycoprotein 1-like [Sinocyclocheilus anshuiensis]|uniref:lysosome-associated membrane glycoprotein 1-like n=1 Tax=Sinocyclocheilus anshuiensis TaxID=1608454 RepID=UPI0007B9F1EC|nr:PREDICTED: lysosome-associated membrane glycoprotein 1-like [Sinocyclocheilus anshuiensis]
MRGFASFQNSGLNKNTGILSGRHQVFVFYCVRVFLVNILIIFFLTFQNKTTKKVYVKYVQYELTYAFKRGVLRNYTGTNRSLELFSVDLGYSYSCKAETVYMGGGVSLDLTQYRVQAFDIKNKNFGPPELCKADQPDYRVPIAVGIILIILIIIVVIAYLIKGPEMKTLMAVM